MNKNIVESFIKNGFLLSFDIINELDENNSENFLSVVCKSEDISNKVVVLNKDIFKVLGKLGNKLDINWSEFEKSKVLVERGKNDKSYNVFLDILNYDVEEKKRKELNKLLESVKKEEKVDFEDGVAKEDGSYSNVIVLKEYQTNPKKRDVNEFVEYFKIRYDLLKGLLQNRQEIQNAISINRILGKKEKEIVAFIGMVLNKKVTKNGNILLSLEDMTGRVDVLVNKDGKCADVAKNIVCDEVIGVIGVNGGRVVFATQILFPDVPLTKELKKSDDEAYAAFISDLHFGSKLFLKDDFMRFINWLNCKTGSFLQKRISSKVKYLFIVGDSVDGVGVYPGQERELVSKDIMQQYNMCAEYLGLIRKDIKIIIVPGQHDSIRGAEPQPPLDEDFARALYILPNAIFVSNPCLVNIHSKKDFEGFNIMLYHGASYHYYIDEVDSLRQGLARDNPTAVMKFLLQKRHLAPTHTSTVYIPMIETDPFFVDKLPDVFVSGEMHRSDVSTYNNIILINCSCFQAKTSYQEKTGNNPNPSRVPILNLKTREVKVLNFSADE